MMNRRRFLAVLSASAFLSVGSSTPVQAKDGLRGGNMGEFVKRQATKQMEKRKQKEEKQKEKADQKEEPKSGN